MNRATAYEQVTERVIQAMEAGVVPWRKPWTAAGGPMSIRGHRYRGMNQFLAFAPFASPFWLTFNQARELGGTVRRGEKGWKVLLWKIKATDASETVEGPPDEKGRRFFATTYTVFNLDQCDGIEAPARLLGTLRQSDPIATAEAIVDGYRNGPKIGHGGDRAFYAPLIDAVQVPARSAFTSDAHYYSTLFHELTHSTGHDSRLARELAFMGDPYAHEELIAELGAAFLSAQAGIETPATLETSGAYLRFWLGKLRDDRKALVQAASAAQRAVDRVLGVSFERTEGKEEPTSEAA